MNAQRLRNLTTQRLHTTMSDIEEDLLFLTGTEGGILAHQLPNVMRAIEPWLRQQVTEPRYWNDKYDTDHVGEYDLRPMDDAERAAMFERYKALPSPFAQR